MFSRVSSRMDFRSLLYLLCCLVCQVLGQNNTTSDGYPFDPILQHRPDFARSLPVQILMVGITMTLTSVLIIHLIFTAQYHWPLAQVNYVLQMSAVTTLLISHIATVHVILSTATVQSRTWPYMLNYVAVDIPPMEDNTGWTTAELAAWLLMNATTSGLIQITHIQFLTLLFPSGLERKLIFCLLGPLAILSSVMHVLRIHNNSSLVNVAAAVQNVCNATLSLLFTISLFLWGCLVNRKQAWRTDGGTAAFGLGALTLALISTAITFLYIPARDQYTWMPGLMWAVILWQSFLGWWWWVGAGMGVGEIEELLRREEKRQLKRRTRQAKRKVRQERAQTLWKGMTGALCYGSGDLSDDDDRKGLSPTRRSGSAERHIHHVNSRQTMESFGSASVARSASGGALSRFWNHKAGRLVYSWYLLLRHAHLTAAREQAVERVERINQAYGREGAEAQQHREHPVVGWGLGSFGIRRHTPRSNPWHAKEESDEVEMDEFAEELEDDAVVQVIGDGEARTRRRHPGHLEDGVSSSTEAQTHRPSSMWWWGPLQRWRLQDSTVY